MVRLDFEIGPPQSDQDEEDYIPRILVEGIDQIVEERGIFHVQCSCHNLQLFLKDCYKGI